MVLRVYNKKRVVKEITYSTESSFHATYKGHQIEIEEQETPKGSWYAWVTHPDGCYIVDGYFTFDMLEDVVKMCLENILYSEKPAID